MKPFADSAEDGFYVVLRDDDTRLKRHPAISQVAGDAAGIEAMRLAAENPGHKFYVLKVVRVAERTPPVPQPPPVSLRHVHMPNSNASPLITPDF